MQEMSVLGANRLSTLKTGNCDCIASSLFGDDSRHALSNYPVKWSSTSKNEKTRLNVTSPVISSQYPAGFE